MMRSVSLLAACAALLVVSACATDPASIAKTPLQRTYAVMQDYETAQQLALTLVENAQTPLIVKDSLVRFEGAATPLLKATAAAARDVDKEVKAVKSGESTEQRLQIATSRMVQVTAELQAAMANLNRAITEAKSSLKPTDYSVWEPLVVPLDDDPVVIVRPPRPNVQLLEI